MKSTGFSVGEVAAQFDVPTNVLRHWETVGLLDPVRDAAGRRRYDRDDVVRVAVIQRSKQRVERDSALFLLHAIEHRVEFSRGHTPLSQVFGSKHHNHCYWLHLPENHYARILPPDFPYMTKGTQR